MTMRRRKLTTLLIMNCKEYAGRAFAGSGHPIIVKLSIGVVAVLVLFLPWNATAAEIVAFADGTRLTVQSYELKDGLVVMTTLNGKLQSVPRSYVDLEITERLNSSGQQQVAPPARLAPPLAAPPPPPAIFRR